MIMETCDYIPWVGAYHDGELPEDRRIELERHLPGCEQCLAELDDLRQLSHMLASEHRPSMASAAAARFHRHVDAMTERSLVRFAELLSGVAAAVLLAAGVWSVQTSEVVAEPLPNWQRAAVTLQPDSATSNSLRNVEWIVSQLPPRQTND